MALIPDTVGVGTGVAPAPRDAAAGDTVQPYPDAQLVCDNTSGSSVTVTIPGKQTCSQGGLHDLVVVVATATKRHIGPINDRYKDPITGLANVNYSSTPANFKVYTTRA